MPNLTVLEGDRWLWGTSTDPRSLEREDETQRRAAAWYHSTELRLRLTFSAAYTGDLHLYVIDWDDQARRQTVTVNDGMQSQSIALTSSYANGAWLHFSVSVATGGTVTILPRRPAV